MFKSLSTGQQVNFHILCPVSSNKLDIEWAYFSIIFCSLFSYNVFFILYWEVFHFIWLFSFIFLHSESFVQLSYQIVDSLIWLGIRDMINDFRKKKLKLRPVTYLSGAQGSASDVPYGYIWSPHLVPKPKGRFLRFLFVIAKIVVQFCFRVHHKYQTEIVVWSCSLNLSFKVALFIKLKIYVLCVLSFLFIYLFFLFKTLRRVIVFGVSFRTLILRFASLVY